jgi:hypothetical protein
VDGRLGAQSVEINHTAVVVVHFTGVEPAPALPDKKAKWKAKPALEEATMTTVWIYINTNVLVGDREHVKVFAHQDAASDWFKQHDPGGVAFEYQVIGEPRVVRRPVP